MSRPIKKVAAGSRVFFRLEIRDLSDTAQPLFSPTNDPEIELRTPAGVVDVDWADMSSADTGTWTYEHQTASTDPLGVYRVQFRVIVSSDEDYSIPQDAFELV